MDVRNALLRTLAFHHTVGHAPTRIEWKMMCEISDCESRNAYRVSQSVCLESDILMDELIRRGEVIEKYGRCAFDVRIIEQIREREASMPRKRRIACRAAQWIASLSSVRFVALCNSAALGHSSDESDLDFFIITRAGTVATTRIAATLPYKILRRRPGSVASDRDTICLSYFITDAALDVRSHMLQPDDPYFRYWFLSLLPLFDDGVSRDLWHANAAITSRHPFAVPWQISPDLSVRPAVRLPIPYCFEPVARHVQGRAFPSAIRDIMNQDTRVIVSADTLKFHVNDRRREFSERYIEECAKRGIV